MAKQQYRYERNNREAVIQCTCVAQVPSHSPPLDMTKCLQPILSLDLLEAELVRVLYQRNDATRLTKVKNILERYIGIDWIPHQRCPRFDGYTALGYQRVCVKRHNDLFDLLVLSWAPGTKSPIHDHPCERCFLMCVSGSLYEERYEMDNSGIPQFKCRTPIPPRSATWISDDLGLHSVGNDGDGVSCSLHCYIPGFTTPCTIFDCETKAVSSVTLAPTPPSEIPLASLILQRVSQYMDEFEDPAVHHRVSTSQSSDDIEEAFKRARCGLKFDDVSLPLDDQAIVSAVNLTSNLSVHTSHRFFFNQLLTKADPVASAADSLASIMNVNMYNYENAPVLMLMEKYVIGHLAQQIGIIHDADHEVDGTFLPGASLGNMTAMHAARNWFLKRNNIDHVSHNRLVVFTSTESHHSIPKACAILGLGLESCRYVPCDEDTGKMSVPELAKAITRAKRDGFLPFFINCTSGSTHSGAFDDCDEIANVAHTHGCWLHVDGALGASFLLPQEEPFRSLTKGIPRADSISWNLHKLLGIPMPCSVLLTTHKNALTDSHAVLPNTSDESDATLSRGDPVGMSIMSSRRADALKAWVLWKKVGDVGMANRVRLVYMHNMDLSRMIREYPIKISIDNPTIQNDVDEPEEFNRGAFHLAYQPTSACTCFYWLPIALRAKFVNEGPMAIVHELGVVARRMKARLLRDGVILISHFSTRSRPHFWRIPNVHQSISQSSMWDILKLINKVGSDIFPPDYIFDAPEANIVGARQASDVTNNVHKNLSDTLFQHGNFDTPYTA